MLLTLRSSCRAVTSRGLRSGLAPTFVRAASGTVSAPTTSGITDSLPKSAFQAFSEVDALFDDAFGLRNDPALENALKTSIDAGLPSINVAPNQGKLLHLLAKMKGAKSILEVGTLGGYSTIWLAKALPPGGRIVTLEYSPMHAEVARKNFEFASVADRIEVRVGAALETLPKLHAEGKRFDFFFIDADKPSNPDYLDWAVKLACKGAVIVGDNVVRAGRVAGDLKTVAKDENDLGSRKMLEAGGSDKRLSSTAVQTIGCKGWDGFMLAVVE